MITFHDLRQANIARLPEFRTRDGRIAHAKSDGSDWSLAEWSNAVCGEAGELANLTKKLRRGEFTLDEIRTELGKEIADVVIYLDLLAFQAGIDMGAAVIQKFNEVSVRVGSRVILG
jgi:NTP pyrophosphatase (non-canonical NTP hydrolase)